MNASSLLPPWRAALVVGLGQSGLSALRLLASAGIPVRAYDRRDALALGPTLEALPEAASAELLLGEPEVPEAAFAGVDAVVLSPGVPPSPVRARQELHAPQAIVHGELSLALLALRRAWPELPTVLVTGTNGKSTVTSLTGALLAAGGMRVFCGGNLGTPLADLALSALQGAAPPDALVIECSSFQLETLERHPTAVAMILNVTPDHLDRYASIADYAATKGRIFAGLRPGGLALLDAGDPWTASLRALVPAGAQVELVDDPSGGAIVGAGPGAALVRGEESIDRGLLALAGRHNSKNALFALAAARHLGVSVADCERGLAAFRGLPHRMVAVGERDGVIYYDDSKATNVASVLASLDGFDRPFVLIAGGRPKGDDFAPLAGLLAGRGRGLVAIGEAAHELIAVAMHVVPAREATSMAEAVALARDMASPGDAVVLSPACASYDWYESYRHRGEAFARAVDAVSCRP